MAEINIAAVHKELKNFFKLNHLNYTLADKTRLDISIRKYAPSYQMNKSLIFLEQTYEQDLVQVILNKHMKRFYDISLFLQHPKDPTRSNWTLFLNDRQIQKINEEDRRIEELEVWRY